MQIHLDGDIVKYRCSLAAEKVAYYVTEQLPLDETRILRFQYKKDLDKWIEETGFEGEWQKHREVEPVENALYNARSVITTAVERLEVTPEEVTIHLSGETNFRNEIGTIQGYKANRADAYKPVHGPALFDYMLDLKYRGYNVVVSDGEEADDTIGYSHYKAWCEDPLSTVVASIDKDLRMIPGLHYNFVKDEYETVTLDEANRVFWEQLLTGDRTDNIPGVDGVGPATARKYMAECHTCDEFYTVAADLYGKQYGALWKSALLENARLIWIRRKPEELWTLDIMREYHE